MPASKFGAAAKRSHPPVVVPSLGPPYFGLECGLAPGSDQGLHERPVGNSVKQRFRGNATLQKSAGKRNAKCFRKRFLDFPLGSWNLSPSTETAVKTWALKETFWVARSLKLSFLEK